METKKMVMTRQDYIDLIKTSDCLERLDELLEILTGVGHGSGRLYELDSFYDVLFRHAKEEYTFDEEGEAQFYRIVTDRMNILLDTHILLWTLTGDSKLPEKAVSMIEDMDNNTVFNSIASIWETEIKSSLGKLPISGRELFICTHRISFLTCY